MHLYDKTDDYTTDFRDYEHDVIIRRSTIKFFTEMHIFSFKTSNVLDDSLTKLVWCLFHLNMLCFFRHANVNIAIMAGKNE